MEILSLINLVLDFIVLGGVIGLNVIIHKQQKEIKKLKENKD